MGVLDKVEKLLRKIIIDFWYVDVTVVVIAFGLLMLIQKFRHKTGQEVSEGGNSD